MKIIFLNKGYTLPELLVSMGIFLVILSLTIANFRGGNQSSELKLKALEVSENIRRVQNNALVALPLSSGTIPDRYGIHFAIDSAEYIIFADRASGGRPFFYDVSEKLETINLGTNFIIVGMNEPQIRNTNDPPICYTVEDDVMDIVFVVPGGKTYFNGVQPLSWNEQPETCGDYNPGRVEVKHKKSGRSVNVMINWISGQISTSDITN